MVQKLSMNLKMNFRGETSPNTNTNSISKHNSNKQIMMVNLSTSYFSSNFKLNMLQRLNGSVSCGSCGSGKG
jgi:hypothetical protein